MKIKEIYKLAVSMGIEKDVRGPEGVARLLEKRREEFNRLEDKERPFFDEDGLFNPFSDTRILYGDPEIEVEALLCGIDMETPEIILADRLREKGSRIDLVVAHHPEGKAQAGLYGVMDLQADMLFRAGIPINVAESILSSRISEVERGILPLNHQRAVDAARLLDMPFMCIHTAADNLVNDFLQRRFDESDPLTLQEVVDSLLVLEEYSRARMVKAGPRIVTGDKKKRTGRILVDMTGGTSGSADAYEKMEMAGVGTVVCMHIQEKHREMAKKHNVNVVVAGHMASDSLGLNLFLDVLEEQGITVIPAAGLIRVKRTRV